MMQHASTICEICYDMPERPQFVLRPSSIEKATNFFREHFIGTILYAVKSNPEVDVLKHIGNNGISHFDVASLAEVDLIHSHFPDAELYFMHPVKSRQAIRQAYFKAGIRHFSLDTEDELLKIVQETEGAKDLILHIRLGVPNSFSEISLSGKFGVEPAQATALLRKAAKHAQQLGVCFHVGSQCMHPDSYVTAITIVKDVIQRAKIKPDYVDIGGGFPSIYPGMIPPNLSLYFDRINHELEKIDGYQSIQFMAEPGRALVAESMSLIVRVELRKDNILYINDGTYGSLFDAGSPKFVFPMRLISDNSDTLPMTAFQLYGPTCDAMDFMQGPFYLPDHIQEGDYIEIGQVGAYSKTLASSFNGFGPNTDLMYVKDGPILSMYE